jgi:hypothetical protein
MLAIKNYGHFWSRELIDWGNRGPGNQGTLKGARSAFAQAAQADFRNQIGIYCLFSPLREVVYVGQTGAGDQKLWKRLRQHSRGHLRDRWTNFSWFGFLGVGDQGQLLEAQNPEQPIVGQYASALNEVEAVLLQILEPRLNKQGPRWGNGANETVEYFQFSDHDPTTLESLAEELRGLRDQLGLENP